MIKKIKLDRNKATYDGRGLNLVIKDPEDLEKRAKETHEKIVQQLQNQSDQYKKIDPPERFCLLTDDSCHKYVLPVRLKKEFFELSTRIAADEYNQILCDEFDQKFKKYLLNKSESSFSFTDPNFEE